MPLDGDQRTLALNTLYNVSASGRSVDAIVPHVEVINGTVAIYGSDVQPSAPPASMFNATALNYPNGFAGIETFLAVPNYLYIVQVTAPQSGSTSIVLTGITAKEA